VVRLILTIEEYLLELDGPVRLGDTIEWYVDDEPAGFAPLEGVIPSHQYDSLRFLAGVEIDDEDTEWIVRGTVTAIAEVRVAHRLAPGQHIVWHYVAGSGRLLERTELNPRQADRFKSDDAFWGYLVSVQAA
jgi:hypothetical protein